MNKRAKSNSIRIIAGSWRGRRIPVLDRPGLRPTTDRVRETVFNWLMHDVAGRSCLDLFAGSGALGFECLSRGADFVQFVESERDVSQNLENNLALLLAEAGRAAVSAGDALTMLRNKPDRGYDLVFLDPPFQSSLLAQVIPLLVQNEWLNKGALIYLEQDSSVPLVNVPDSWQIYREGSAGQSCYRLYSA